MSTCPPTIHAVCHRDDIIPDTGVCALVEGQQVALFRLRNQQCYAVGNRCPFAGANVMSRGIVGSYQGIPTVASPIYKQRFDLRNGRCLDDPSISLGSWEVLHLEDGSIAIGARRGDEA